MESIRAEDHARACSPWRIAVSTPLSCAPSNARYDYVGASVLLTGICFGCRSCKTEVMMFDRSTANDVPFSPPSLPVLQFVSVEIMPLNDEALSVSLSGTYLDEDALELVAGDIERAKVASIDEALGVIRRALCDGLDQTTSRKGQ